MQQCFLKEFSTEGQWQNFFLPNRKNAGCQGLPKGGKYMKVRVFYNYINNI